VLSLASSIIPAGKSPYLEHKPQRFQFPPRRERSFSAGPVGGFMPAYAGNTISQNALFMLPPVHPRACGEHDVSAFSRSSLISLTREASSRTSGSEPKPKVRWFKSSNRSRGSNRSMAAALKFQACPEPGERVQGSIPKPSSNRSKSSSRSNRSKSLSALPRDGFATRLGRPVGFSACPEWFAPACRSAEVQIV